MIVLNRLITLLFVVLIMGSCSTTYDSMVMIGAEKQYVIEVLESLGHFYGDAGELTFHSEKGSDTLSYSYYHQLTPMSGTYVFEEDACIFQSINMYCSPCYEKNIKEIKKDKKYKFSKVDNVNYISKDKKTLVRIVEKLENESCSNIMAKKLVSE